MPSGEKEDVRGLQRQGGELRAGDRAEEPVVRPLREEPPWSDASGAPEDVRGLPRQGAELRAGDRAEETVVRPLREEPPWSEVPLIRISLHIYGLEAEFGVLGGTVVPNG